MSAPNEWRRGKHAKPGRYHLPPIRRETLFLTGLFLFVLTLTIAAVPVGVQVGQQIMQAALAR